jgi:hypothetical protein
MLPTVSREIFLPIILSLIQADIVKTQPVILRYEDGFITPLELHLFLMKEVLICNINLPDLILDEEFLSKKLREVDQTHEKLISSVCMSV